jgi:hypothetical protein
MNAWGPISLTAVTATGNVTQLYPAFCTAGTGSGTLGTLKRGPCEGVLLNLQVETDGINGGKLEVWDVNGNDGGDDVDTAVVITNAHLAALVSAGKARKIYEQNFVGSAGARLAIAHGTPFVKGLAARFSNDGPTGTCSTNIIADGGFRKTEIIV